ncbi:MAG: CHAT domain-containing protein [Muribaculaceae bacterium]|nr:CHAT domain-containing protein [Muribaculaceae bacterium]
MTRLAITIIITLCTAIGSLAWHGFSDVQLQKYENAIVAGLNHDYFTAMKQHRALRLEIDSVLNADSVKPYELPDNAFKDYMRNMRSEWECAYQLNGIALMRELLDNDSHIIKSRNDKGKFSKENYNLYYVRNMKMYGGYYYAMGDYDKTYYYNALGSYETALEYYRELGSYTRASDSITVHAELAQLYYKLRDYKVAVKHLSIVKDFYEYNGPIDNLYETYTQYALCLAQSGQYTDALAQIKEALSYCGGSDDRYAEALRKKGKILSLQEEATGICEEDPESYYQRFYNAQQKHVALKFALMTAEQREHYWMRIRPFIADCYRLEDKSPQLLYNVTLFNKGILLQLNRNFFNLLSDDEKSRYKNLQKKVYSQQNQEAAEKELQAFEQTVMTRLRADKNVNEFLSSLKYTWKDIRKHLSKNDCAIEFVQYERNHRQNIGALVLKKNGKPQFVKLAATDDYRNYRLANGLTVFDVLSTNLGDRKDYLYNDTSFSRLIWTKDLMEAIGSAQNIYFAPDGIFHQIAIEYMLPAEYSGLKTYRLTSTRQLIKPVDTKILDNALICGGINYNSRIAPDRNSANDHSAYKFIARLNPRIKYLTGAAQECASIYDIRDNNTDTLLHGSSATEGTLLTIGNNYNIIHLSTHGCFGGVAPDPSEMLNACASDRTLSESAFMFAGAETNIKNRRFDSANSDGILSAREISASNLENVNLFVASACQTGLGYVTADGVYGIQRGLKNAGVGAMIVSLWSVSDEATRIFMTALYKHMKAGDDLHTAFDKARDVLCSPVDVARRKFNPARLAGEVVYESQTKYDKPQYRNAFILIDAIDK